MYDYLENMKKNIKDYIKEYGIEINKENREEIEEQLNEDLWDDDNITGNGSGSYTFSTYEAEKNLNGNWDLLNEALEEFGANNTNILKKGAEWCDVTIRCYLLGEAIGEVLNEMED